MEFRLRTCLYTEIEFLTVGDDFFHHGLYLVDLDGIDHVILSLVVILLSCLLKATPCLLNPVVEDIREAEQYWGRDITQGQLVHHFTQVYLCVVLTRCDIDIALFVDAEIGSAPTVDVVELLRVLNGPFLHIPNNSFNFSTLILIFS